MSISVTRPHSHHTSTFPASNPPPPFPKTAPTTPTSPSQHPLSPPPLVHPSPSPNHQIINHIHTTPLPPTTPNHPPSILLNPTATPPHRHHHHHSHLQSTTSLLLTDINPIRIRPNIGHKSLLDLPALARCDTQDHFVEAGAVEDVNVITYHGAKGTLAGCVKSASNYRRGATSLEGGKVETSKVC